MIQNAPASCAHQVGIRMIRITSAFSAANGRHPRTIVLASE
jgi:hypothetical protein